MDRSESGGDDAADDADDACAAVAGELGAWAAESPLDLRSTSLWVAVAPSFEGCVAAASSLSAGNPPSGRGPTRGDITQVDRQHWSAGVLSLILAWPDRR